MPIKLHPIFPFADAAPADGEQNFEDDQRHAVSTAAAVTVAILIVALLAMVMGMMA